MVCPDAWEVTAQERTRWRGVYSEGVNTFEEKRTTNLKDRRMKQSRIPCAVLTTDLHVCEKCNRVSRSKIGLISDKEIIDRTILVRRHRYETLSSVRLSKSPIAPDKINQEENT